jgi:hypothetical protein
VISISAQRRRNKRGASLALVAACAAGIVLLIIGCFQLAMLFGGGQDARNAMDAGALNVSKRAIELKETPTPDFTDCADSTGGVGLANINRVWGKTLLETANDVAMQNENLSTDNSRGNVNQAFQSAQSLNDGLFSRLNDGRALANYFEALSTTRVVATPKEPSVMVAAVQDAWKTARIDRGAESNMTFMSSQFPPAAQVSPGSIAIGGQNYLTGYSPFRVGDKEFAFVSFRTNEMPHLIGQGYFQQNRTDASPIPGVSNAVPNAFEVHGVTNDSGTLGGTAYAAVNPQRSYMLAIPHAFVTIRFANTAKWYVNGTKVIETTYGLAPETQWGVKKYPLPCGGTLNGYASLGNEYGGQISVMQAIKIMQGDPLPAFTRMVQRMQEVDPTFNESRLEGLLSKQKIVQNVASYVIYPIYTGPATNWPDLTIDISPAGSQKSAWVVTANRPEGSTLAVANQQGNKDSPNTDWQMISGGKCRPGEHYTLMTGQLNWQPGTGYVQSLGELSINHTTDCYFSADAAN